MPFRPINDKQAGITSKGLHTFKGTHTGYSAPDMPDEYAFLCDWDCDDEKLKLRPGHAKVDSGNSGTVETVFNVSLKGQRSLGSIINGSLSLRPLTDFLLVVIAASFLCMTPRVTEGATLWSFPSTSPLSYFRLNSNFSNLNAETTSWTNWLTTTGMSTTVAAYWASNTSAWVSNVVMGLPSNAWNQATNNASAATNFMATNQIWQGSLHTNGDNAMGAPMNLGSNMMYLVPRIQSCGVASYPGDVPYPSTIYLGDDLRLVQEYIELNMNNMEFNFLNNLIETGGGQTYPSTIKNASWIIAVDSNLYSGGNLVLTNESLWETQSNDFVRISGARGATSALYYAESTNYYDSVNRVLYLGTNNFGGGGGSVTLTNDASPAGKLSGSGSTYGIGTQQCNTVSIQNVSSYSPVGTLIFTTNNTGVTVSGAASGSGQYPVTLTFGLTPNADFSNNVRSAYLPGVTNLGFIGQTINTVTNTIQFSPSILTAMYTYTNNVWLSLPSYSDSNKTLDAWIVAKHATNVGSTAWTDTNSYLWCFDGSTNSSGSALDISGNANTAVNNGATWARITNSMGVVEAYWNFNGSSAYQQLTSNSLNGSGDYTLGAWIRYSASAGNRTVQSLNGGNGDHLISQWKATAGILEFYTYEGGAVTLAGPNLVSDWQYLVMTRVSGVGNIYTNGVLAASGNIPNVTALTLPTIGARDQGSYGRRAFWPGDIYRAYAMSKGQSIESILDMYAHLRPTGTTTNAIIPSTFTTIITGTNVYGGGSIALSLTQSSGAIDMLNFKWIVDKWYLVNKVLNMIGN